MFELIAIVAAMIILAAMFIYVGSCVLADDTDAITNLFFKEKK